jgi:hypothetical protein
MTNLEGGIATAKTGQSIVPDGGKQLLAIRMSDKLQENGRQSLHMNMDDE